MPKDKRGRDIPGTLERSDKHAQEIWTKTHDSAVETYGEGERAHRTAFSSLKHSYRKVGDHWEKKAIKGPSDEQAKRGAREPVAETKGGEVEGMDRSKADLMEEAKKLEIPGRSKMNKEELAESILKAK